MIRPLPANILNERYIRLSTCYEKTPLIKSIYKESSFKQTLKDHRDYFDDVVIRTRTGTLVHEEKFLPRFLEWLANKKPVNLPQLKDNATN
jgi:hypothetical protein